MGTGVVKGRAQSASRAWYIPHWRGWGTAAIVRADPAVQAERKVGAPQGETKAEPPTGIWNLVRVASRSGTSWK